MHYPYMMSNVTYATNNISHFKENNQVKAATEWMVPKDAQGLEELGVLICQMVMSVNIGHRQRC